MLLCNFDETSMMVKKFQKKHVYTLEGLEDPGTVAPPAITSMTLFICIFFDGFIGPSFIIIPEKKFHINEDVKSKFKGNFKVKFKFNY
jgi:hypothetical protein